MGGVLLGIGLRAADLIAHLLPRGAAYALADLIGRSWYRLAPSRRALVASNLARVCAATGRPASGRAFRRLVRQAFVEHARYYLEVLRIPHGSIEEVGAMVSVDASCVIVASVPSPPPMPPLPPPPAAALGSGTRAHFPAKFGGACASVNAVASVTAIAVNARLIESLLLHFTFNTFICPNGATTSDRHAEAHQEP